MHEYFQASVMDIFFMFRYETNVSSLCFTVYAADPYESNCISI